jgi:Lrp/AsnC family transcriptional regulator, cysteine-sensing transcriptional activator
MPAAASFFLMSGEFDHLIRAVLPAIEAYDALYKRLIARVDMQDVASMFAMEQIEPTTERPPPAYCARGSPPSARAGGGWRPRRRAPRETGKGRG